MMVSAHISAISLFGDFVFGDEVYIQKGTATATARQLIRLKYPQPDENFGLSDVSEATIDGITRKFYFVL